MATQDSHPTGTDMVSARAAQPADITTTAALAAQARASVRPERGGRWLLDHDALADPEPQAKHAAAVSASDEYLVVGCIDDTPVGYARAYLSPARSGRLCMIDELVVHPDAQAIGVGSAILDAVRLWAVHNQCQAIESQVLPGNRAAKNFFERVGMKTRKMRVSADL